MAALSRVRDWLYVGSYRATIDLPLLREHGVGAMLQLAEEVPQPDITHLYLNVNDGEPLPEWALPRGVGFVRAQRAAGNTVMVACGAGISRSVTFAMAALHEEERLPLEEAYRAIVRARRIALPHPDLLASLYNYYQMNDVAFKDLYERILNVARWSDLSEDE